MRTWLGPAPAGQDRARNPIDSPPRRDVGRVIAVATAVVAFALAGLASAGSARAAGVLSESWSPTNPTSSSTVEFVATVTGCGAGNVNSPSLYLIVTGPNNYDYNPVSGATLSENGNVATAKWTRSNLASGTYSVQVYGRGEPCFASSFYFTYSSTRR